MPLFGVKKKTFNWSQPFALTLTYTREFSAKSLAKTTAKEMARLGSDKTGLNEFRDAFRACIDDVIPGDRITALPVSDSEVQFFQNGKDRCTLERPKLKKDFFEIWLGDKSKFQCNCSITWSRNCPFFRLTDYE